MSDWRDTASAPKGGARQFHGKPGSPRGSRRISAFEYEKYQRLKLMRNTYEAGENRAARYRLFIEERNLMADYVMWLCGKQTSDPEILALVRGALQESAPPPTPSAGHAT